MRMIGTFVAMVVAFAGVVKAASEEGVCATKIAQACLYQERISATSCSICVEHNWVQLVKYCTKQNAQTACIAASQKNQKGPAIEDDDGALEKTLLLLRRPFCDIIVITM